MKMHELDWPPGVELTVKDDPDVLAEALAQQVGKWLADALAERGQASMAVSGGSTPIGFFDALSSVDIDWSRVSITLADERWVPPDHPDSNERLVRKHLLQKRAAAASFVGLKQAEASAGAGQGSCEKSLEQLSWPLDVLVLGMGNDGHTASLFPDAPELGEALAPGNRRRCMAMHPPSAGQARMTLTRSVLGEARHTVLHLGGKAKLETLQRALADITAVHEMPIRAFLGPQLRVYWSP